MKHARTPDTLSGPQKQGSRSYHSPVRRKQAEATRQRILSVAGTMLVRIGYARMTIAGIAREAGVSPPTIYAAFKSKRGILAELLDLNIMTPTFHKLIRSVEGSTDPYERLRLVVQLIRIANELELPPALLPTESSESIDTELWKAMLEREHQRRPHLLEFCRHLREYGVMREDLEDSRASEIVWAVTARPVYYMLVTVCGWSNEAYEAWVYGCLARDLFAENS